MTRRIVIGTPTGWSINTIWQANFENWYNSAHTDELVFCREPSNTKAVSYSNIIRQAYEDTADGLLLFETNIISEVSVGKVIEICKPYDCVVTPGRFADDSIGIWPKLLADSRDATHDYPVHDYSGADGKVVSEFAPIEIRTAATHLVWMSRKVLKALVKKGERFMWEKAGTKLDHDIPIYCYDGDFFTDHPDPFYGPDPAGNPYRRLAIEMSLYANVQAQGFKVWADARLLTTNLRLGGAYRSFRYADYASVPSSGPRAVEP